MFYPMSMGQLKTNRGLIKFILLSAITFGIYGLVVMTHISRDINTIAGKYDGKKTTHFCLMAFVYSWLTGGIAPFVWFHKLSDRISCELRRRGIDYPFGAGTFWLWGVVGMLFFVGPLLYLHKLFRAMNQLSAHYNRNN